jgi:iron complex outermembrane receptor protein
LFVIKRIFLIFFIITLLCFNQPSFAQDKEIEEIIITGSYIKVTARDGSSPVDIITREEIEGLGAFLTSDITKNLSINSGSENNTDAFTSGNTQGTSNVNLRGLGLSSTLVLIDGRRQTVTGATANDGSVFVNTSTIPLIAIERVEVLKEGAASIYGSDAVSGVVNYIFRRDFVGAEFELSNQRADAGGQEDRSLSFIIGNENDSLNWVLSGSLLDRSAMKGSEKPEISQLAVSGLGNSFLLFGPSSVNKGPYEGSYNAYQNVPDANCIENKGIIIPQASGSRCGFLYGPRFNLVNDEDHENFYGSIKKELNNGIIIDADFMYSSTKVNDNPQSPSYPALSYLSTSNLIMPETAGNPFGVPVMWLGRPLGSSYLSPLAPRSIDTKRFSLGMSGEFGNGFDWDIHFTSSEDEGYISQPDTSTQRFTSAIRGQGGVAGDQTWNLFDSSANTSSLVDWISTKQETWTDNKLDVLDFVFSGDLITNSFGVIAMAAGLQFRKEEFSVTRDIDSRIEFDDKGNISKPADLLFLGGGIEASAKRNVMAAFAEFSIPFGDKVSLKAALRYEELEDDNTFDPKISLRYQLSDTIVLRGSLSTSFREPSLSQLYSGQVGLQGIQDYSDGNPKGGTTFIRIAQNGNDGLSPEESENLNLGILWNPKDNLSFKMDYWAIDYSNVITIESPQGKVINNPLDLDVKRTVDGTLIGVTTKYFNAANVDTNGIDIEINYSLDTDLGSLTFGLRGTHILKYEIPDVLGRSKDVVGLFNHDNFARSLPETKIILTADLINNLHTFSLLGRYMSDYKTTRVLSSSATSLGYNQNIDEWLSIDSKYNYSFEFNENQMRFSLGVKNIFNEDAPQVYDAANFSYDPRQHDPRGRLTYIGIKLLR